MGKPAHDLQDYFKVSLLYKIVIYEISVIYCLHNDTAVINMSYQ